MENKNNQGFKINESDELNKLNILNSALLKELRKSKEENAKLKHEKEILDCKIKKLEEENKTLKGDFSSTKNQNPDEETMEIVENVLQSNYEIKECMANSQKYKCDFCNKCYASGQSLKTHFVTIHDKQKKFKCDFCGKSFGQKVTLKSHVRTVHEGIKQTKPITSKKEYKCQLCGNQLSSAGNLNKHINAVHGIEKDYKCDLCDECFINKERLTRHKDGVHGEKTFKCSQCDYAISLKDQLKLHMKNAHGEKRTEKCDICDRKINVLSIKRHKTSCAKKFA